MSVQLSSARELVCHHYETPAIMRQCDVTLITLIYIEADYIDMFFSVMLKKTISNEKVDSLYNFSKDMEPTYITL